jgi:hypothetical protein
MRRSGRRLWRWAAVGALAAVATLAVGCCCVGSRVAVGPGQRGPLPEKLVLPVPSEVTAPSDSVTEVAMRNILFHVDDDIRMRIASLRGRMRDLRGERIVVLDDKETLLLEIGTGEIALTEGDLTLLLNRYVFGYPGSPLRNLVVHTEGARIVQTGVLHKIVDIPFEMIASLSATPAGEIRIHPDEMRICGVDGMGLLEAVGADLSTLLDLSGAKGVRVEGNDLLLDPLVILPPPRLSGRLTDVRVRGKEIVQRFGDPGSEGPEPLTPTVAARNYVQFRGGSIRFGKLYMVHTDLEAIDLDENDPFDFYLDYYATQLVAGHHITTPNDGLVAYMPDFASVDSALAARPSPSTVP